MRARILILLIMAAGVGFGTLQFARGWLESQRAPVEVAETSAPAKPEVQFVLVADRGLSAGQFVTAADLRWQAWPDETLAASYVVKGDGTPEDFAGAVVRSRLGEGEPINGERIVMPGDRGFLAAVLTPGMRAVSVPVNKTSGVAGLVFPGDKVDVILTHTVRPDLGGSVDRPVRASETVLRNVRVLAIDQRLDNQDQAPKVIDTVTLEVEPAQAERINVVMELGALSLSLRSLAEVAGGEDMPPRMALLSGLPPAKAALVQAGALPGDEAAGNAVAGTGEADAGEMPTAEAVPEAQTFTLDSDVSMLFEGSSRSGTGLDSPEVTVVRGSSYRSGAQ